MHGAQRGRKETAAAVVGRGKRNERRCACVCARAGGVGKSGRGEGGSGREGGGARGRAQGEVGSTGLNSRSLHRWNHQVLRGGGWPSSCARRPDGRSARQACCSAPGPACDRTFRPPRRPERGASLEQGLLSRSARHTTSPSSHRKSAGVVEVQGAGPRLPTCACVPVSVSLVRSQAALRLARRRKARGGRRGGWVRSCLQRGPITRMRLEGMCRFGPGHVPHWHALYPVDGAVGGGGEGGPSCRWLRHENRLIFDEAFHPTPGAHDTPVPADWPLKLPSHVPVGTRR